MADAGRVIAGSARGIRLRSAGPGTRALGDRVKQTLFAILEPEIPGRRALDLFAGTGAGGIEALSRGSPGVVFVDADPLAVNVIAENLARCRLDGMTARVVRSDALDWLAGPAIADAATDGRFGIVLVDPPYDRTDLLAAALDCLGDVATDGILDPDAIVVAKSFWRDAPSSAHGLLASERARRFGETALTFYRRTPRPNAEA